MRAVIDIPRFKAFVVWGVNDKYSWLGPSSKEQDLPLLFDVDNKPKLAYFKIEEVLEESMLR
jgi:GH35 family endo-1,4-beta-xylanase